MIKTLKKAKRLNETLFMWSMSLFCFIASLFRFICSDRLNFLFLNWNLFLAFIPWALTTMVIINRRLQESKIILFLVFCIWLLFFPNAPYILTDLFHLKLHSNMPVWFDLLLILSFAWTGLLFGFLSLWNIEKMLQQFIKPSYVICISVLLLFVCSFGVYAGRFLRWNSWDILTEPINIVYQIGDRFINPYRHPRTWGMTFFMGLFLNMIYLSFRFIQNRNK